MLEVGTGSGYSAAVLAELAAEVISVERHPSLAAGARLKLDSLGVRNVDARVGDGTLGIPELAPFEAIAVHAAAPAPPPSLLGQLADGGRLVIPIAVGPADMLTVFRRRGEDYASTEIGPCRFVPLVGEEGFERLRLRTGDRVRVDPVLEDVVAGAAAAVDRPVVAAVDGVDEVGAALAEEGVGALVAEEAVLAGIPDQEVGAVGALEALVVAVDLIVVAAAGRTAGAAELHLHRRVGAAVGDGVVAGTAVESVALAGGDRGDQEVVAGAAGEGIGAGVGVEDVAAAVAAEAVVAVVGAVVVLARFEDVVAGTAAEGVGCRRCRWRVS